MMSIFSCNLCPLTFATRGELASHEFIHHITPTSASTTYQPNQGSTIAGSSSGVGGNPWQIDPFEVFNSAFSTGDEAVIAANTIYWMSRDRRYAFDYSQPIHNKLETSDDPPSAKRHCGASKTVPLVLTATRRRVYRCDECPMEFSSYHALGGHKSGHRKAEARLRAAEARSHSVAAQLNQMPAQPQPQPQEAPPPAPPPLRQPKYLFNLNEPPPE